ncbi:hypothetical protein GW17_00061731 [Ensete ventricosum]|nr:hypothetical protein GW17_00061731 [Ensete ventricosum]RZS18983.1 hypothetical protein BHM03_00051319 [Ensete ventricosum]
MYPLRFPNSGIRAKQTQQGGGWAASHRQASYRGDRLWPRPLQRGDCLRPARKGLLALGEAAGVAPTRSEAAWVGCLRRGHKGSTHPRPARRGATPAACIEAALVQRGKRRT